MKKYLSYIIMTAVALVMAASCEKPAPQPGPQPDPDPIPQPKPPTPEVDTLKENSYRLDDETYTFQSVAVSNLGENIAIAATPSKDVNDFQSIFEQDEYFYVAVSPLLNGSEFDLMTETGLYTVISTLEGAYLETVAPSMIEEIQEGKCSFNYADNKAVVTISITLADGAKLEVSMSAEEAGIIVNENIFSIDGNDKPVRTAFYQREDGMTAIYLTPAGIDFFEDLEIVTYYAYIILEDSQCHGKTLSVNDIVAAGYVDNVNSLVVDSNDTETTGILNVLADQDDPAHFVVSADLNLGGSTLKLRFDGTAIDALVKETVRNELIYEGQPYEIEAAYLDMKQNDSGTYTLSLKTERGDYLRITMPEGFFDGNAYGFSQSPDFYIEYDGQVYSKALGSSGTARVSLGEGTIEVEATNYENIEVTYVGAYEQVI